MWRFLWKRLSISFKLIICQPPRSNVTHTRSCQSGPVSRVKNNNIGVFTKLRFMQAHDDVLKKRAREFVRIWNYCQGMTQGYHTPWSSSCCPPGRTLNNFLTLRETQGRYLNHFLPLRSDPLKVIEFSDSLTNLFLCFVFQDSSADTSGSLRTLRRATGRRCSSSTSTPWTRRSSGKSRSEKGGGSRYRRPRRCWKRTSRIMWNILKKWYRQKPVPL